MPRREDAPRDLLFGLLALQNGMVTRDQLVLAFGAWTGSADRSLADLLAEQGAIDGPRRALIEALADAHLKLHGDDVGQSLSSLEINRSTRESLSAAGGPEVEETLTRVGSGSGTDSDAERTATFAVGTATSEGQRFRVLRPHARGGLGAVFVALDEELNREVALKRILDDHADDPASRARFVMEAEITGGLEHPGIVPVYGLGTYDRGRPYYAMRFIRGDSLKAAIAQFHADADLKGDPGRRSLELRKLLRRFTDICNAIEYAHSRGVLHRDIKPGNVIVGKHGETLVVDWGLAKPLGKVEVGHDSGERTLRPSSSSGSARTLPGSALGTPAYMSPEQAAGNLEQLGPRSDVYSLGATLHCLLTGKAPFEGDAAEVLRKVQRGEFATPRQLDPSIDRALEAVCLKAMAQKPEDRYASGRELAEDVERWMADEPVSAWHEPWTRGAARWLSRHRTGVAAAVALLVTLAASLGVSNVRIGREQARTYAQWKRAEHERGRAEAERARAEANLKRAFEAVDRYYVQVSESKLLTVPGLQPLRTDLLKTALTFYEDFTRERRDDPRLLSEFGRAYQRLAILTAPGESPDRALELTREAIDVFRRLIAAEPDVARHRRDLAVSQSNLAYWLAATGRIDEAQRSYDEAAATFEGLAREHPDDTRYRRDLAKLRNNRGLMFMGLGDVPHARDAYLAALAIREELARRLPDDLELQNDLAQSQGNLGNCFLAMRQIAQAERAYRGAGATFARLAAEKPEVVQYQIDLANTRVSLGMLYRMLGRAEESGAAFREALEIRERVAGLNPSVADYQHGLALVHGNLGDLWESLGRAEEAEASYRSALAIWDGLAEKQPEVDEYQRDLAATHGALGVLFEETDRPEQAEASYGSALGVLRRMVERRPQNPRFRTDLAKGLANLGKLRLSNGPATEAAALLGEAALILDALPAHTPDAVYEAACVHALYGGAASAPDSGLPAEQARSELERAVGLLRQAAAVGYRDLENMRTNAFLAPIRDRPDFKLLLMDLAWPANPFAPD